MKWIFLVLGLICLVPPVSAWLDMKANKPSKISRKAFFGFGGLALLFFVFYIAVTVSSNAIYPIIGTLDIGFFISLILAIYYFAKGKKQKEAYKSKLKYSSIAAISLFVLFAVSLFTLPSTSTETKQAAKSETQVKQKQKSEKTSSKKAESQSSSEDTSDSEAEEDDDSLTKAQVKKINKQLVKDIEEDQKYATNGDTRYDWSQYVLKVTIDDSYIADVYVDGSFLDLSEAARNEVASRTNGLIGGSIVIAGVDYSAERGREGIYMNFHNGPQYLGRSKFTDHTEIKWNNKYFE